MWCFLIDLSVRVVILLCCVALITARSQHCFLLYYEADSSYELCTVSKACHAKSTEKSVMFRARMDEGKKLPLIAVMRNAWCGCLAIGLLCWTRADKSRFSLFLSVFSPCLLSLFLLFSLLSSFSLCTSRDLDLA